MNISQLVRGLAGEARPGEQRSLELKTGQVVRATVTEVSENGREAVVSVNGVSVRAALDAPMQPGQTTWMRVQGQQADGLVILKPTDGPSVAALPSMEEALKQSGLPDEAWARRLLQDLQKAGLPLTKELAAKLSQAMAAKPPGVAASEWMQAAGLALRRQLPLTADTLSGLRQAMFGKPLTDLLSVFMRAGDDSLALGSGLMGKPMDMGSQSGGMWTQSLREAQALVRALLAEGLQTGGQQQGSGSGTSAAVNVNGHSNATGGATGQSGASAVSEQQNKNTSGAMLNVTLAAGGAAKNGEGAHAEFAQGISGAVGTAGASVTSSTSQPSMQAGAWIGRMLQLLGVTHEQQAHRAAVMELTSQPQQTAGNRGQSAAGSGSNASAASTNSSNGLTGSGRAEMHSGAAAQSAISASNSPSGESNANGAPADKSGAVIGGAGRNMAPQEAAVGSAAAKNGVHSSITAASTAPGAAQLDISQLAAGSAQQGAAVGESLKSALLHLLQAEGVPHALREAAQQLVQHITGQQLLLASDRQAPFSHITLFVPLVTPDGKQTAAVHIQSRQSKRGELDAGNCRLWFDLNMKTLGRTLVDVQVVDNAVALHIHHDDERIGEWMDGLRGEAAEALERIGYQLSAFRTLPLPERSSDTVPAPTSEISMDDFAPKPYKGVDMKI